MGNLGMDTTPKNKMLLLLAIGFIPVLFFTSSASAASTNPVDIEALRHLKSSIDPATLHSSSCLGSWDFSHDPCGSISTTFICGIRCDEQEDPFLNKKTINPEKSAREELVFYHRVTSIVLDGYGYKGRLSPFLGNLSALKLLDVSGNYLSGELPSSLGKLQSLVRLDLSSNRFTGSIPASLSELTSLRHLSLASNSLSGLIPEGITRLSNLKHLYLNSNSLSGQLPSSMPELFSLLYLDCSSNALSGQLQRLPPSLLQLSLRNNRFTGPIPANLRELTSLEVLDLSKNFISGSIGSSVFLHPALQQVNLADNRLGWIEAPSLVEMVWLLNSRLIAVDASRNMLRGRLPAFPAALPRLSSLALTGNSLGGAIPLEYAIRAIAAVQPLRRLFLDGNMLVGALPPPFLTWNSDAAAISASFANNCLQSCPLRLPFCGVQRPAFQCV